MRPGAAGREGVDRPGPRRDRRWSGIACDRAVASGTVSRRWFRRLGFLVLVAGAVRALQQALRPAAQGQAPPGPAAAPDDTPRAVPRPAASTAPPADRAPSDATTASPASADEVPPPNESPSSAAVVTREDAAPAPAAAGTGTGGPAGRPSRAKKAGAAKKAPAKKAAAKKAGPAAKKAATAKKEPAEKSAAAKKAAPARPAPAAKKSTPTAPTGGDAPANDASPGERRSGDTPPG
jgi:hypothetical protein